MRFVLFCPHISICWASRPLRAPVFRTSLPHARVLYNKVCEQLLTALKTSPRSAFVAEEVAEAQRLEAEIQHQEREQWKSDKKKELAAKGQEFQDSVKQKIDKAKADFDAFMAKLRK